MRLGWGTKGGWKPPPFTENNSGTNLKMFFVRFLSRIQVNFREIEREKIKRGNFRDVNHEKRGGGEVGEGEKVGEEDNFTK